MLLVDLYMAGFAYYLGLTMNNVLAIQLSFALGIAVDFSTHIAHTYLHIKPPAGTITDSQKREYKAKKAISQMGSSVFHGGFSTFIAIGLLGFAKLYSFIVFFKAWMCILTFGMLNGIILLPILLSMIGPIDDDEKETTSKKSGKNLEKITDERKSIEFSSEFEINSENIVGGSKQSSTN